MKLLSKKNMPYAIKEFLSSSNIENGCSQNTLYAYNNDLSQFSEWTNKKNYTLSELNEVKIENYIISLGKRGYKVSTISRKTASLKAFFKFLLKEDIFDHNLMASISRNNKTKLLPQSLSQKQIKKIFNFLEKSKHTNFRRDRVIFEVLYGCGLRVSELASLNIYDINFEDSTIKCMGKGGKQRQLPINDICLWSIDNYIQNERNITNKYPIGNNSLLLNNKKQRISRQSIWSSIKKISFELDIQIKPHTLRHTFATDLLKGGANIRQVQELLGHSSLSATQIYTQMDTEWIKKEYYLSHPRA
tara:strand:- start:1140 stop:2048 length:909 start_codon:yes stop_codon:yes gene_type:complete